MERIEFLSTSPNALANLISRELKSQLQDIYLKLSKDSQPKGKEVLSRKETADFFGVSLVTIHDWVKSGIIKPYKVGKRTYFKRSELMQVINQSNPENA